MERKETPMSRGQFSRRQFLARAAVGAGAAAGAGALASAGCTTAGTQAPQDPHAAHGNTPGASSESFVFFTTAQGRAVDAIAERLIPADELGPGAREAGVVFYIDRALVGPYANLKEVYRSGLAAVNAYSQATHGGAFLTLSADKQDAVLQAMDEAKATGFTAPTAKAFFEMLLDHVREGMFSDPSHGGNRNFIGWKLLRHPGVQWEHPATAQANGYGADLQIRAAGDWGFRR
jgi:gluconate 2-dehydrogenase gamma chain